MLRKLVILFLAASMLLQAPFASARDLTAAFGNLLSKGGVAAVNKGGRYESSARNTFIAGGLEMRMPKQDVSAQLFSFTPPKVTVGCNGVSAFFGGFSFISSQEFEQLVKSIASGAALGFVTMLTLKSLCPQCADVVQQLKNAAQVAARLSIDACKLGMEAAKKFQGEPNDFASELCGATTTSGSGTSADFLSSISKQCNTIVGSTQAVKQANPGTAGGSKESKSQESELECKLGVGNVTWAMLGGAKYKFKGTDDEIYARKTVIMNMMGVVLRVGDKEASCETPNGTLKPSEADGQMMVFCPPQVEAKDITGAFMCGTDKSAFSKVVNGSAVISYCKAFFDGLAGAKQDSGASLDNLKLKRLMVCEESESCKKLVLKDFAEANVVSGVGFLPQVAKQLATAVDNVRNNKPMDQEIIDLMEAAPYPLYQAVNAAAVYPVAAADLLDSLSILVAESAAGTMLEEFLRVDGTMGGGSCTNEQQVRRVIETLAFAKTEAKARKNLIASNMAAQQGMREQIRQINLAIQQQVMSGELLQQNKMAAGLASSLSPTGAGNQPTGN
ncbi:MULTISPECIES: conjugal transfer protein TraH [unclassified Variovorax]|uniref:conjugal transfer protein TraH n=1 Tax=unclassified Variovorax TaxID=663243 RepID=UPI00076CCA80|nr:MULTISPECIES: conjugal transfer protein TraH [unclassified Variovorax]KWT98315.1 IncF plasmid conjugative transfer pilus assembly protein TraH [Variovorax sp. WDL1]PNG50030.1 hypothetical protein CHC06_05611 [Variovorax sp. B2]PNG50902.1 hypothetical protein CHC07_05516 [Variovorax sp. B4]VTU41531.1 conjugal transfer pilus assembly protein TraH [Variovorax sp. SRS16]VTU41554.1 conjugal transfer pilus assembly protein TraH [Variovorax sp. PBL-E5]